MVAATAFKVQVIVASKREVDAAGTGIRRLVVEDNTGIGPARVLTGNPGFDFAEAERATGVSAEDQLAGKSGRCESAENTDESG